MIELMKKMKNHRNKRKMKNKNGQPLKELLKAEKNNDEKQQQSENVSKCKKQSAMMQTWKSQIGLLTS